MPMTSTGATDGPSPLWSGFLAVLLSLGCIAICLAPVYSQGGPLRSAGRGYGPTTPSGYRVWIEPQMATMAHSQRLVIQVTVQDAQGEPAEGVEVHAVASEGTVTPTPRSSRTRDGVVQGVFTPGLGGDQPRTAYIIVTVENVEVTIFIDIVPAVFGR